MNRLVRTTVVLLLAATAQACSDGGSDGSEGSPNGSMATSGVPPTADDLVGIWVREGVGRPFVRFDQDGTFAGDTFRERLFAQPQAHGTYEVQDGAITITIDEEAADCPPEVWVWEATLTAETRLVTVTVEAGTIGCSTPEGAERVWIRIGT